MTRAAMNQLDRAKLQAVQCLAALPSDSWQLLQDLARANTSGRLGLEAWAEASGAIVGDALRRYEAEGKLEFGEA